LLPPKIGPRELFPGELVGTFAYFDSLRRRFRVRRAVSTSHLAAGPRIQNLPKFSPPLFSPRQRPRIFPFLPRLGAPAAAAPAGDEGRRDTASGSAATFQRRDKGKFGSSPVRRQGRPCPRRERRLPRRPKARVRRRRTRRWTDRWPAYRGRRRRAEARLEHASAASNRSISSAWTTSDIRSGSELVKNLDPSRPWMNPNKRCKTRPRTRRSLVYNAMSAWKLPGRRRPEFLSAQFLSVLFCSDPVDLSRRIISRDHLLVQAIAS